MATVKATVKIDSTDLLTNTIAINTVKSRTVSQGGIQKSSITAAIGAEAVLLAASDWGDNTHVYILNTDVTSTDEISVVIGTQTVGTLAGGEWCMLPWDGAADIKVGATTSGTVIEFGVFSV